MDDRLMSSRDKPPPDGPFPRTPSKTTRAFCVMFKLMLCSSQEPVTPPVRTEQSLTENVQTHFQKVGIFCKLKVNVITV